MGYSPWGHKESDTTERLTPTGGCMVTGRAGVLGPLLLVHSVPAHVSLPPSDRKRSLLGQS